MTADQKRLAGVLVLLWALWEWQGTGTFSYVGYDEDGNPVPLVPSPEPVPAPIPNEIVWQEPLPASGDATLNNPFPISGGWFGPGSDFWGGQSDLISTL